MKGLDKKKTDKIKELKYLESKVKPDYDWYKEMVFDLEMDNEHYLEKYNTIQRVYHKLLAQKEKLMKRL